MANLLMRFPGGRAKTLTLSYDDGVETDIRLMEIMNRYGLKGTFNVNAGLYAPEGTVYPPGTVYRRMTESQVRKTFVGSGHEVAVHGLEHPYLEEIPFGRAAYEIAEDRRRLEELTGGLVRGMAYPYGTVGAEDWVVELLKAAGIRYARTTVSSGKFQFPWNPETWLRLPATCHHNDPKLMELADQFLNLDNVWGKASMFYLWGHSYEFDGDDNWEVIEKFAQKMGGHQDIWYATNIEIRDYADAYTQLRFNIDMTMVENPTATDVWFLWDGKMYEVKAGQTLRLG